MFYLRKQYIQRVVVFICQYKRGYHFKMCFHGPKLCMWFAHYVLVSLPHCELDFRLSILSNIKDKYCESLCLGGGVAKGFIIRLFGILICFFLSIFGSTKG